MPVADVLVPIDPAATRFLRVVTVKHLDPIEADQAIKLGKGRLRPLPGDQVVAGRRQVLEAVGESAPLDPVLREDLRGFAAVDDRAFDGLRDAAGDGQMSADTQHAINVTAGL